MDAEILMQMQLNKMKGTSPKLVPMAEDNADMPWFGVYRHDEAFRKISEYIGNACTDGQRIRCESTEKGARITDSNGGVLFKCSIRRDVATACCVVGGVAVEIESIIYNMQSIYSLALYACTTLKDVKTDSNGRLYDAIMKANKLREITDSLIILSIRSNDCMHVYTVIGKTSVDISLKDKNGADMVNMKSGTEECSVKACGNIVNDVIHCFWKLRGCAVDGIDTDAVHKRLKDAYMEEFYTDDMEWENEYGRMESMRNDKAFTDFTHSAPLLTNCVQYEDMYAKIKGHVSGVVWDDMQKIKGECSKVLYSNVHMEDERVAKKLCSESRNLIWVDRDNAGITYGCLLACGACVTIIIRNCDMAETNMDIHMADIIMACIEASYNTSDYFRTDRVIRNAVYNELTQKEEEASEYSINGQKVLIHVLSTGSLTEDDFR